LLKSYLASKFIKTHSGIVRAEAVEVVKEYISRSVERYRGVGVSLDDVADIFYLYERVGSRGRCNVRCTMPAQDLYSPFTSRAFIEAVYSVPVLQRPTEPFHYGLTYLLSPELHALPFEKDNAGYRKSSWRSQRPVVNLASMVGSKMREEARDTLRSLAPPVARDLLRRAKPRGRARAPRANGGAPSQPPARDRGYWFQAKREEIREMCLDCSNSAIWNYVDRAKFEEYTAIPGGPPLQKSAYLGGLYIALTMFCYETFNRAPAAV
jgi:hypothetical protein